MKKIVKDYKGSFFLLVCLIIVEVLFSTAATFSLAGVVNTVVALNLRDFISSILWMSALFLGYLIFMFFRRRYQNRLSETILTYTRLDVTTRLTHTSYENYVSQPSSQYVSWLTNDMSMIDQSALTGSFQLIEGIVTVLISIIALLWIHWGLLLLTVILTGIMLVLPAIAMKSMGAKSEEQSKENEYFTQTATDYLQGFSTLFSLGKQRLIPKVIDSASHRLNEKKLAYKNAVVNVQIAGGFGNILSQILNMALSGYLALYGYISVGVIITTSSFSSNIFNTVGTLSQLLAVIKSTQPIFNKFDQVESVPRATTEGEMTPESGFVLDQVSFQYDGKQILKPTSYQFQLAGKYAIVGPSGVGKSTLLNIMGGRLENYQGSLTLSNQEISSYSYQELYDAVLYIDQSPHIFNTTIRENLALGDVYSDQQIMDALQQVKLADIVRQWPQSLDTQIGQGGHTLSGGQYQRIALARGLLRGQNIILLDEATSSLDHETALSIEQLLIDKPNLTVVMVSHHLDPMIEDQLDGVLHLQ